MSKVLMSVGALTAFAGLAFAQAPVISFTYSDLSSSFDAGTGAYAAVATSLTSGDVSRLDSLADTAEFMGGTLPGMFADVQIAMTVSNVLLTTADGNGWLVLTDKNGDTLEATIDGEFKLLFGAIFFEGFLSNAFFTNNSGDGTFDGTTVGSFAMPTNILEGALVELFFNPGNFFFSSFSDQITLASGLLVPGPGSAALLAFGGIVAARRRRA